MSRRRRGILPRAAPLLAFALTACLWAAPAAAQARTITVFTDQTAGPPLMGLGVELDPYDKFQPTAAQWDLTFQRLDFMRPGFLRVVEPAYEYFAGYDALHNPRYRWNGLHVQELRMILDYAKSRGITVVLGDWLNPIIGGDPRIPADFLQQLHDTYGYTNIKYYNLINEPNDQTGCDFHCWTSMVNTLSREFSSLGLSAWLQLIGPDNANSWDDTAAARALDRSSGLDGDNPIGGDSWVTRTLRAVPGRIGAYDSHRYATIWGIEHGVYGDQMRTRREQISNADSPAKPYFEGELGMTARQVSPFTVRNIRHAWRLLAPLIDPSARPSAAGFVDSQPNIRRFVYGVWTSDMMIQAIAGGLSGGSAWDLDDAMHTGGQYGSQNLKRWGFWNSLGGQDGYPASDLNPRPWFYSWSVLARSFPAGSQPLLIPTTGVGGLRMAAAKIPVGQRYALSFALVNDSGRRRAVTLRMPAAAEPISLARYDYFSGDRPVDANGFAVPVRNIRGARLSSGLTVTLPSRGLVVLSSVATGDAVALREGTHMLLDALGNWHAVAAHSKGLKLDHSARQRFDDDRSRAAARSTGTQSLVYRVGPLTSFKLKAYYRGALGLRVYVSGGRGSWRPIGLESTNPAPALAGHGWYLAELLPAAALPSGAMRLKVELLNRQTELGQASIEYR